MGREKKKTPAASRTQAAQARRAKHERSKLYTDGVWQNLAAVNPVPALKHKTYYESIQNTEKKKKLEFEITTNREPPPGLEFVPTGHPELTNACKELSREQGALFFIVSDSKDTTVLDHHMNRVGCHFRQTIVDSARQTLESEGLLFQTPATGVPGQPEPIPKSQPEINREADAMLRDLFPRIPNTDRHEIIAHAFKKDGKFQGDYKVGMAKDLTLARRVQLAALAHIRHTMTRYDELLKETDWANARKAVEKPCLDIIVKWRGDEETGRDQLDEILREVIEISDTEDDSGDESSGVQSPDYGLTDRSAAASPMVLTTKQTPTRVLQATTTAQFTTSGTVQSRESATPLRHKNAVPRSERRTARKQAKAVQRFKRYAAAADAIAEERVTNDLHPTSHSGPDSGTADKGSAPMLLREGPDVNSTSTTLDAGGGCSTGGYRSEYTGRTFAQPSNTVFAQTEAPRHDAPFFVQSGASSARFMARMSERTPPPRVVHVSRPPPESFVTYSGAALQDLLVPSVEPASPLAPAPAFYPLRERHNEHRYVPMDRPAHEYRPTDHAAVGHSRPTFIENDGSQRSHRQAVTFFPEDYERPSRPTLVPLPAPMQLHEAGEPRHAYQVVEPVRTIITAGTRRERATPYHGERFHERYQQGLASTQANPIVIENSTPSYIERGGARYVPIREMESTSTYHDYGAQRPSHHVALSGPQARHPIELTQYHHQRVSPTTYTDHEQRTDERQHMPIPPQPPKSDYSATQFVDHERHIDNSVRCLEDRSGRADGFAFRSEHPGPASGPVYVDSRHSIAHYEPVVQGMQNLHPYGGDTIPARSNETRSLQEPFHVRRGSVPGHFFHTGSVSGPQNASHNSAVREVIWVED